MRTLLIILIIMIGVALSFIGANYIYEWFPSLVWRLIVSCLFGALLGAIVGSLIVLVNRRKT